jgi:hypothetical protein
MTVWGHARGLNCNLDTHLTPYFYLPVKSCQCSGEVPTRLQVQSTQNVWKWPYKSVLLFPSYCLSLMFNLQAGHGHRHF